MKKTIAILLLLIIAATMLCGCGKSALDIKEHHGNRFETVAEYDDCKILVDMETGVEYARRLGYNSLSVMFDSYGNPLIYPGFDAREDKP